MFLQKYVEVKKIYLISHDTKCKLKKAQWKVSVQDFWHPEKDVIYPVTLPLWVTWQVFTESSAK